MRFKKISVVLVAMTVLAFGAQSALANTNIYEQNNTQNNSPYTPELFQAGGVPGDTEPRGYNKLGTLSSVSDNDYYLLDTTQIFPGTNITVTLVSPYNGPKYEIALFTETGGAVQKEWLVDDEQMTQFRFTVQPNTRYIIRVHTYADTVSPYNYQLSVN
ncbi:hypothetical protein [Paenibacillus flagellatus]|uniref:hypothetical protein n=1 Tax=Paenibacillus flagellatus TaxID=2211139 RepID=UPI0011B48EF9|nr:hypothetical protein [Paenibacillus flagellatus]